VHAAAVGTGDLRGCDGWTGGGEGSLDERRRGKAGSGQRVRCDGRRDEDAASSSRAQQRNRTTPYAATGALEKGKGTVDSGQWQRIVSLLSFLQPLLALQSRGRTVERPERPLIGRIASHPATNTDTGA
jgi:hypothetical protein